MIEKQFSVETFDAAERAMAGMQAVISLVGEQNDLHLITGDELAALLGILMDQVKPIFN